MNRRTILKGGVVLAAVSHGAAVAPTLAKPAVSVDDFLGRATAAEKVRYHAEALAEAMNQLSPGRYVTQINLDKGWGAVWAKVLNVDTAA